MSQADGSSSRLLRVKAFETVYGTTPSVSPGATVVVPVTRCGFKYKRPYQEQAARIGAGWQASKPVTARSDTAGPLAFLLNAGAHGYLLTDAFGNPTTTDLTGGKYQHIWKHGGTPPVGASFEAGSTDVGKYNVFSGMRWAGGKIAVADVGGIDCEWNYVGQDDAPGTSSLDSAPTSLADTPFDLGNGLTECMIDGGAVTDLGSLSIEIARSAGSPFFPLSGAGAPTSRPLKKGPIKLTGSFAFEDYARYTAARAGTPMAVKVISKWGTGAGTAGNEYVELYLPEVIWEPESPDQVVDDGVVYNWTGWAYYTSNADATALKVTMKCPQSTFAS